MRVAPCVANANYPNLPAISEHSLIMNHDHVRWTIWTCAAAAVLAATFFIADAKPLADRACAERQARSNKPAPRQENAPESSGQTANSGPWSGRTTVQIAAAHAVHRRGRCRCRDSGHAGRAVLCRLGARLQKGSAAAARTVAHSLDRRLRRRVRRGSPQRPERRRQPAGLCRRHRRKHRRADGAVRLCRPEIRRGLDRTPTPRSPRRIFSRSARPARAFSIPGRSRS